MTIEHRDRIADRVERPLPLLLAVPHRIVQPRVLHGDDDLAGDDGEQPFVGEIEAPRARGAERQHAEQIVCRRGAAG